MKMHNDNVIRSVASKKFSAQKSQNVIACIAIMLTTFMVYTVFSLGISFYQNMELQAVQEHGTCADLLFPSPSAEQTDVLNNCGLCSDIGLCTAAATLTNIRDSGIRLAYLRYADDVCWEKQLSPALLHIEGHYPREENEIMMPRWAAEKLGLANPQIGQELELTYYYGYIFMRYSRLSDDRKKTFVISGLYDDASSVMVSNEAPMYISESFFSHAPGEKEQYRTAAYISLKDKADSTELSRLLALTDDQELQNLSFQAADSTEGIIQTAAAALLIILCGGLIIYNILYISVTQDIRFLGQLKTLGMTKRQLKKYIQYQVNWLCLTGIPAGLVLAALVSGFLVPLVLHSLNSTLAGTKIHVSFSPVIFASAVLIAAFTVFLGSRKALRIAGSVSPISASRYASVRTKIKERKKAQDSICSFAWRNVFRNRKSAAVVFLSLFLAGTVYLSVSGTFSSLTPSAMVSRSMAYDISVKDESGEKTLTEAAAEQIAHISGVKHTDIRSGFISDDDTWIDTDDAAVRDFCEKILASYPMTPDEKAQAQHTYIQGSKYATVPIGIGKREFSQLAEEYSLDIEYREFQAGQAGIWCYDPKDAQKQLGCGPLTVLLGEKEAVLEKMAQHPVSPLRFDTLNYLAPNIIVSNEMLLETDSGYISEIGILTEKSSYDADIRNALRSMFRDTEGIVIQSKQEKEERLSESFSVLKTIASSLSFLLFVIGIMNFINTIYAGILARDKELAMLECIGMSKKQVKQMLVSEGLSYMAVTTVLIVTAGTVIYLGAFKIFSSMTGWDEFHYPVYETGIIAAAMLLMAVIIPLCAYRSISREHAAEQLRKTES